MPNGIHLPVVGCQSPVALATQAGTCFGVGFFGARVPNFALPRKMKAAVDAGSRGERERKAVKTGTRRQVVATFEVTLHIV